MANQLPKACFRWKDASDPASPQGELSDRWKRLCTWGLFFSVSPYVKTFRHPFSRLPARTYLLHRSAVSKTFDGFKMVSHTFGGGNE
jgi:hypothetical protein